MPNQPIRKGAGQSVEEMASQLYGSTEGNRLYTPKQHLQRGQRPIESGGFGSSH